MRWFLSFYLIGCYLLFSFFFLFFNGYQFEGMPLGTRFGQRDISGMNYKQTKELANLSVNQFESLVFMVDLESEKFQLEHGSDFFIKVDTQALLLSYREFRGLVPWYRRALEFISLEYEPRPFPVSFVLDRKATEKSLNRRFSRRTDVSYRVENDSLFQVRWTFDFTALLEEMEEHIQSASSGIIPLSLEPIKEKNHLEGQEFFTNRISVESFPVATDDRVSVQLAKLLVDSQDSILINPGEEFSMLKYFQRLGIPQTTRTTMVASGYLRSEDSLDFSTSLSSLRLETGTGTDSESSLPGLSTSPLESASITTAAIPLENSQMMDDIRFEDYYGLSLVSSLMFRTFLKLGFQILRHSNHPYFLPGVSYFQPGLDSRIGPDHDLKVLNSSSQPFRITLGYDGNIFTIEAYACLEDYPAIWLKEAYRNIEYADMITLLDLGLDKGEKKIIRKPVSGLSVGIFRLWKDSRGMVHRKLVWKSQYESMEGVIHVGEEGMNVFNPENWEDLGLDESYTLRDSN